MAVTIGRRELLAALGGAAAWRSRRARSRRRYRWSGFLKAHTKRRIRGFDRLPWRRWASIGAWVVSAHAVSCFEVFSWQCGVSCNG